MENKQDRIDEFGEFGEIEVKNCHICSKTIRQKNCFGFTRAKDTPNYIPAGFGSGYIAAPKSHICLKCLLKGLYSICPDKKQMNNYFDTYIKVAIAEQLEKQQQINDQNQKI